MPVISALKLVDLKQLLRARNLSTVGTKVELIKRLTENVGSDEIELDESSEDDDLRSEIDNLRGMVENLTALMQQQISAGATSSNAAREEIQNVHPESPRNPDQRQRSIYSVREIADTLPEYDPTKDAFFSIEQFVDRVGKIMAAYQYDEQCLMLAIYSKLKGPAKLWLDASADLYVSWQEMSEALIEEFGNEPDEADIHFKMSTATRKSGESVNEYCFRMSALGKRNKLSESAIIKYTREGLKHRELQLAIATVRFKTMKDMREAVEEYFANVAACSSNSKTTVLKRNEYTNKIPHKSHENIVQPAKERKPIVCFNCSEVGHVSSACPKPQRRARCTDCQRVHPRGSPENCGRSNLRKSNNVKKHTTDKEIMINGLKMFALVDTGSECSMVKRSKATSLPGERKPCCIRISGVCGGTRVLKEKIKATLLIDNIELLIDLYVADDDIFSSDIIIGNDVFAGNEVSLVCDDDGPRFEHRIVSKTEVTCRSGDELTNVTHGEIDEETCSGLYELINKYRDVFGSELNEIGLTNAIEMKIQLTTSEPITSKPYRLPEMKKVSVRKMIDELLSNSIITKSTSEYASPIVIVKKKNGSDRLCVDYRRLNQYMVKEIFPTPNIEERLQEVLKFKLFTILDLNSGYYQIPIEKNSRKFTAFVTPDGLYEFTRMPFGLKNAPAVFQRLMALIREKTQDGDVIHYMDDIVIGADNTTEMFQKITRVFTVLRELNLTLNINKCEFLKRSVEFLGHQIHSGGISPGAAKTNAIAKFKTPTSVREVRQFLGLSGYFRKFVPGYALISEPLRSLLKKDVRFHWGNEQENAFRVLKEKLIKSPVIVGYKVAADHQIHTDASTIGVAGVLLQGEDDGWKPVAFFSRSTTNDERKYHSYELETLAVVETLERFRYYIYGKNITVITDCSALKTTMQKKDLIPRIARWWLRIQDFDINIEHRSGQRMQHVDALSRAPCEAPIDADTASLRIAKISINRDDLLCSMQIQDGNILEIIRKVKAGDKHYCNDYEVKNERLFRKIGDKRLWVVPKSIRYRVIQGQHDNAGHLGVEKTLFNIQKYFWFPRMRNAVKSHIKSCIECAYNKIKGGKHEGEYHYDQINPVPFNTIHIDHLGPFPKTTKRNEYILVIVDAFTKFSVIKAVKTTATKHVINILNDMSEYFGMPARIVTDRGTAFTSRAFEQYCTDNDVTHILNAVRTPRANGHAERTNRTLLSMLLPSTNEDKRWDDQLRRIQWSINSTVNKTTGKTPQELLYGFKPRDILQNKLVLALHNTEVSDDEHLQQLRDVTAKRIDQQRMIAKQRYDAKHIHPTKYKVGDLILVENEPTNTGMSRKLEPRFKGPFIVTNTLDKDRYVIEDLPGSARTQRHYTSVYASDKMKPWCSLPPINDENSSDDDELDDDDNDDNDNEESNRGRLKCRMADCKNTGELKDRHE